MESLEKLTWYLPRIKRVGIKIMQTSKMKKIGLRLYFLLLSAFVKKCEECFSFPSVSHCIYSTCLTKKLKKKKRDTIVYDKAKEKKKTIIPDHILKIHIWSYKLDRVLLVIAQLYFKKFGNKFSKKSYRFCCWCF